MRHARCCKWFDQMSVSLAMITASLLDQPPPPSPDGPAGICYQYLSHFHCRKIPTVIQICLFEQHELCAMHVTEERAVGMVIVLEMLEQSHVLHSDTFIWVFWTRLILPIHCQLTANVSEFPVFRGNMVVASFRYDKHRPFKHEEIQSLSSDCKGAPVICWWIQLSAEWNDAIHWAGFCGVVWRGEGKARSVSQSSSSLRCLTHFSFCQAHTPVGYVWPRQTLQAHPAEPTVCQSATM